MKSKKFFFNFEKNDKHKSFDDNKSNANNELNANAKSNANANAKSDASANNLFDDINENENQTDFAKNPQKKKTR